MMERAFKTYNKPGRKKRAFSFAPVSAGLISLEFFLLFLGGETQARHRTGEGGACHFHFTHALLLAQAFFCPALGFFRAAHVYIFRPLAGLDKYDDISMVHLDKPLGTEGVPPLIVLSDAQRANDNRRNKRGVVRKDGYLSVGRLKHNRLHVADIELPLRRQYLQVIFF